ncbi:MAG TPA: MBL fold metallo-hydrolase, partial [Firmicutes bacterium]|nr:MBL fold metallo-hydrolase [Bacillota bacterium]
DFGSEYNPAMDVQPTTLQELLDANLVPYVNNMFDPEIPLVGYRSTPDDFEHTAVFLSHVHLDHTKIINYLNPSVPCYTLEGTKSLLNTLNINDDFLFPLYNKKGENNTRDITGVKENEIVTVGQIKVKVMPIDHDAYGSCGLVIETPDLTIAYTGDLRIHGYRKDDTFNFCREAENCDVLMIEGVSVSFQDLEAEPNHEHVKNEPALLETINHLVAANPNKQITFNYYIANIERIVQLIKTCPRTVVLDAYSAYVVKQGTGIDAYYYQLDDKAYGLNSKMEVAFETLLQDQSEYVWQLDTQAYNYIDQLQSGGIYIHSNAQPLGDFDPMYAPFVKSFEERDIEFVLALCSGHAHPQDLMTVINTIKPKLLVPIHSYRPEKLTNEFGDRLLPVKGQTI